MEIKYKITAYSPGLTQEIREIELDGTIITDARLAAQRADSFAQRLRDQQHMQATDWQGVVSHI
jgi:hypothetical protein